MSEARRWLGQRVRVFPAFDRQKTHPPMAEGEVVYYIDGPSIGVRDADGTVQVWPVSMPIDALPGGCRACGAPDHPSGCADDLPNLLAVTKHGPRFPVSVDHPDLTAPPHEHQWIDVSELQDADAQERCVVAYCDAARTVPR